MKITLTNSGTLQILRIAGRLEAITAPELEHAAATQLSPLQPLIINMAAVDYISSAGLRVLLKLYKRWHAQGQAQAFCGVRGFVQEMFMTSGFEYIFTLHPDEKTAVQALSQPQGAAAQPAARARS